MNQRISRYLTIKEIKNGQEWNKNLIILHLKNILIVNQHVEQLADYKKSLDMILIMKILRL